MIATRMLRPVTRLLLVAAFSLAHAQQPDAVIRVRLEPFPPLITEQGGGLAVDILRHAEQQLPYRFDIQIMSYSRARFLLERGQADVLGATPAGAESEAFYRYAEELAWRAEMNVDLFVLDPALLAPERRRTLLLGTPLGNGAFLAELTGLPRQNFIETTLPNLVRMLRAGRIDGILFERASTMTAIQEQQLPGVHYQRLLSQPASLAVARTAQGRALKAALDPFFNSEYAQQKLQQYHRYNAMPLRGVVPDLAP